jgi:transcription elongation GreA/GreB family factor
MSRAFVKEPEGDEAGNDLPERPQSTHPNYISPGGLRCLKEKLEAMIARRTVLEADKEKLGARSELQTLQAEIRFLQRRIEAAIPVEPNQQGTDAIRFGATVELLDAAGALHRFTIVGEDEADAARDLISWVSPLGSALLNRKAGELITWRRPAGDMELEIAGFSYVSAKVL